MYFYLYKFVCVLVCLCAINWYGRAPTVLCLHAKQLLLSRPGQEKPGGPKGG